MKVLIINSVCGIRSTGKICTDIANKYEQEGYEVKIAYGRFNVPEEFKKFAIRIGSRLTPYFSALESRIFDNDGFNCKRTTKKFLKWADEFNPDVVWIHNIHDHYINVVLLFEWIKSRPQMEVKWTLHDCWPFTGHCTHFSYIKCDKWKTKCANCPQKKMPPKSLLFDCSSKNFFLKQKTFTNVNNMTIIVPSQWLAGLVKKSFLKEYKTVVVHNTINLSIFKPTSNSFREEYHLENKKIILGVAVPWTKRKGITDFFKLSTMISDKYKIVLVGLDDKQIKKMPKNILGLKRTNNPIELAKIYSAADLFFNPTYEDNFPTVNLEAQACGTPVITYRTGGAPETILSSNSKVIEQGDLSGLLSIISLME